ncbi:hypothetical protein LSTR_LSTR010741 [Laodelphax striatellus]|uniref:Uncharacterized protein n=1 Tax=Laodelphax striatellus TaxID=195883 RepID=A0A482WEA9_LAOST|nr:hypothetical protein LSTR_LSTR017277 [Laodelphax striatellus]RZF48651.1 hypothetical protein LSTR_LSTR010741 [Laodelphax striatellus]
MEPCASARAAKSRDCRYAAAAHQTNNATAPCKQSGRAALADIYQPEAIIRLQAAISKIIISFASTYRVFCRACVLSLLPAANQNRKQVFGVSLNLNRRALISES